MRKMFVVFLLGVLLLTCAAGVFAAPGGFGPKSGPDPDAPGSYDQASGPAQPDSNPPGKPHPGADQQLKDDAQYILHRTATAISSAMQSLGEKRRNAGLALAVANQMKARDLFMAGSFQDAIYHSLRARALALNLFTQNRMKPRPEFMLDQRENHYRQDAPPNAQLDQKLDMGKVGKDKDVLHLHVEMDIN